MTRAETGRIEASILNLLYRMPHTIGETTTELHERDAIPPYWSYPNVGAVMRRLHRRRVLSRLETSFNRTVLWWAG